ncbi:MAG: hypothetical protein HFJ29_01070 [Clostridia bacterium]|nr:hypothetical protein [Clostridia bacterium]
MRINRKTSIIITIISIIAIVVFFVPFEQWIFRFDTPEEALKFDYTAKVKNIIHKIEIEDFALIIYESKDGGTEEKYLVKDERGWKTSRRKYVFANKSKITLEYSVIGYHERGKNLLIIEGGTLDKEESIKSVSDNINTNFQSVFYEYDGVYHAEWVGVIEEYPREYKLYIDDEVIEL